jgi:hypothetical protein
MIAEHYILKMLNNYFQYQFNFSVLECCCSLTKKMKKNLLVSPWCVMKDSGPVFIKQLMLRVPPGVLIYHINKKPIIFLFGINLNLSCFMNTGPGYFWSSNDIFFLEEEGKVEGLTKNYISRIKTNPGTCILIKKKQIKRNWETKHAYFARSVTTPHESGSLFIKQLK